VLVVAHTAQVLVQKYKGTKGDMANGGSGSHLLWLFLEVSPSTIPRVRLAPAS